MHRKVSLALSTALLLTSASVPAGARDAGPKPSIRVVVDPKDKGHMHADAPVAASAKRAWDVISALAR